MLETQLFHCPYCGEPVEAVLDLSAGDQQYIEDCAVCCRPIVF
ncbi:MAG TPA: CPXCG motif-containing cysteine-rich protein, partial [Pseudomonas sp.]|nr:CPXCG motif-containing cysteine-rich protein [Pseudomonas sp.]